MARGLDHIVHAVHDLDAAVEFYRRLGFQVGARNLHPPTWGTQNHIIQLPGTFIEILAVADLRELAPHTARHFSFGAFNRDFLARGQGLSMLVLEGRGASDSDEFRQRGISNYDLYEFEREGKRPDGTSLKVSFALAFASDPLAPETGFFTCQHQQPEKFWNPEFQVHANTAVGIAGVVFVANDPGSHSNFLRVFTGADASHSIPNGIAIKTPRGDIDVVTPAGFVQRFGASAPDVSHGARLAAMRIAVRDASLMQAVPEEAGISGIYAGNATVVGPTDAMGAVLIFEQAGGKAR